MQNVTLKVNGMSCNHCVNSIEGALNRIDVQGKVDLTGGTVAVVYDEDKTTVEAIVSLIEEQGYDVV